MLRTPTPPPVSAALARCSRTVRIAALSCAAVAALLATAHPAAAQWRQEIAGQSGEAFDLAGDVTVDSNGDVVATGALDTGAVSGSALATIKFDGVTGAELWRTELLATAAVDAGGRSVAVDASDDVYVAGGLDLDFSVIKLDAATGAEQWRYQIDGDSTFETFEEAMAVAVDGAAVYAVGFINNTATGRDLVAARIDAATGLEVWSVVIDGGDGSDEDALDVVVDPSGDVIVGGKLASAAALDDFTVIKFAAADGMELWRTRIDGSENDDDEVMSVAVDASGDVAAAGVIDNTATREDFAVAKLSGATGAELWRVEIDGAGVGKISFERARDVIFDSAGDVIATGELEDLGQDMAIVKLDGATGSQDWLTIETGADLVSLDASYALAADSNDDVLVAGRFENAAGIFFDLTLVKVDGASGATQWKQSLDGTSGKSPGTEAALSVVVDAGDDAIVAGYVLNRDTDEDFTVMKLDGETGIVGPVDGSKIVLKEKAGKPQTRKILATLRDELMILPAPGSAYDPTVGGAEILLLNPDTGESDTFTLAGGSAWSVLGGTLGFAGYRYNDKSGSTACRSLLVRPGGSIKAKCIGKLAPIGFSLDEPSQGVLEVSVSLGGGPKQCGRFGGDVQRDEGTSAASRGQFKARRANAPFGQDCP